MAISFYQYARKSLILLHFTAFLVKLTEGRECKLDLALNSYPHRVLYPNSRCSTSEGCMFINLTRAMDIGKQYWEGTGYGCESPIYPLCSAFGAQNACADLKWKTIQLFNIGTVTIYGGGKICCCRRMDNCNASDPTGNSDPRTKAPSAAISGDVRPKTTVNFLPVDNRGSRNTDDKALGNNLISNSDYTSDGTEMDSTRNDGKDQDTGSSKNAPLNQTLLGLICAATAGFVFLLSACVGGACLRRKGYFR